MNKSILTYYGLILFWILMLIIYQDDDKKLWATFNSPNFDYEVSLYQKDRIMHQAPEILVYYQRKGSRSARPIGNILLPEDNRTQLSFDYEWEEEKTFLLKLNCKQCMIDQRVYKVVLDKTPMIQAQL